MFGAVAAGVPSFGDLAWKAPVRCAQLGALPAATYSAGVLTANANGAIGSIDAYPVSAGDRVLLWQQATTSQDGIYTVVATGSAGSPWVMRRATDCDEAAEMVAGLTVTVLSGDHHSGVTFYSTAAWTPTSGDPAFATTGVGSFTNQTLIRAQAAAGAAFLTILADSTFDASLYFGLLSGTADVRLRRTAAAALGIDDGSAGNATLDVTGLLKRNGRSVITYGATALGVQTGTQQVGGSIAAGGTRTDTVTLPTAFADASYTVALAAQLPGFTADMCYMALQGAPVAASFSVRTVNKDSAARQPVIHWIALHP